MKQLKLNFISRGLIWFEFISYCFGHPRGTPDLSSQNFSNSTDALHQLLQVFGLKGNVTNHRGHPHPPQYMLELYRTFADGKILDHHFMHHIANTVRSFFVKGSSHRTQHYHFNLEKEVFSHEEIVSAEFHFYCDRHVISDHTHSHVIQVLLYEMLPNSDRKLLEARLVSAYSPGWEVFKITSTASKWLLDPDQNKGLMVDILDISGRKLFPSRTSVSQISKKPILIVFSFDTTRTKSASSRTRVNYPTLQSSSAQSALGSEHTDDQPFVNEISMRSARSAVASEKGLCSRHELRVDFEKLGWSSWIISPKWYDAYVCSGTCAFPMGQNQRPTNHATVQSIVHELGISPDVDAPCCAPTELHPVSLLYFDEHMNVVLKQYEDMVATECGCQ